MNTNKIATGSVNKKLLAALAVLAVAFVVLAAVPAVATDSDADTPSAALPTGTDFGTAVRIASVSAISSPVTGATWTYDDGFVKLTGNTSWSLATDVTVKGIQMDGYNLSIASDSGKRTLTIENDLGKNLLYQGQFDGHNGTTIRSSVSSTVLKLTGVNLAISNTSTEDVSDVRISFLPSAAFYLDASNASITITDNGTNAPKTMQVSNTFISLDGSTLVSTTESGLAGGIYWKLNNSTVTTVQSEGNQNTNIGGYFDLTGASSVKAGNAFVYSMSLAGTSTFTATGFADVYDGPKTIDQIWTTDNTNMVMSQLTLGSTTSASAASWDTSNGQGHGKQTADSTVDIKLGGTGGSFSGELDHAASVVGKVSVPANGSIVLNRGESITTAADTSTSTAAGSIVLKTGATLVLDADQHQPVVFTSKANDTEITSVYDDTNKVYKLGLSAGNLELTSGSYTVEKNATMTLSGTAKFSIGSGAALKVDNTADFGSTVGTMLTFAPGSFTNSGVFALTDTSVASGSTVPAGVSSTGITKAQWTALKAVDAYAITVPDDFAGDNITGITVDTIGYAGEVIDATPAVDTGFVAQKVGYGTTTSTTSGNTTTSTFTFEANAVRNSGYDSWSFTMPAKAIEVNATDVGAYTATFIAVDSQTHEALDQYTSEPYSTRGDIDVPSFNLTDYKAVGYYKEKALLNKFADVSAGKIAVEASSVTIYVAMDKMYKVEYAQDSISGAIRAQADSTVEVVVAAEEGYEFVVSSGVTVTYTLNGAEKTIKATLKEGITASVAGGTYTFEMPAADVVVSGTFAQKYTLTVNKYSTSDNAYAPITITKVDSADAVAYPAGTGVLVTTNTKDAATQSTQGRTITISVGAITPELGYAVGDLVFKDAAGNELEIAYTAGESNTYTFKMPGQDVYLTVTYGATKNLYVLSTGTSGTTTAKATGATLNLSTNSNMLTPNAVTIGAPVTLTVVPTEKTSTQPTLYAVKTLTIKEVLASGSTATARDVPYEQDGTTYTFAMPSYDVAVTVEYALGYTIDQVNILSEVAAGSVDYKDVVGTAYADGAKVTFAVSVEDGYTLSAVNVYAYASGSTTTPGDVIDGYALSTTKTAKVYYDKDGQQVTLTMPNSNVAKVDFEFTETKYGTLVVNVTDGNDFGVYSDAKYKNEIAAESDGTYKVEVGKTVWIHIQTNDGSTIVSANATKYTPAIPAQTQGGRTTPASTVQYALTIVLSPADGKNVEAAYSITLDSTENATYTVTANIDVSELQAAKNAASDYIESVRDSESMKTALLDGTTFAASADSEDKIFTTSLAAVDAATTLAGVTAAQNDFDDKILPYVVKVAKADLDTAFNNGSAYKGYTLALADYNTAISAIDSVADDSDDSIQEELDAVIAAYSTGMAARTAVNPTPTVGEATEVTATIGTRNGATVIQLTGIDGYIPAGTITLSLTAEVNGASYTYTATLAYTNADQKTTDFVAFDTASFEYEQSAYAQLLSSVYAVSVQYTSGNVSSEATPTVLMTFAQE